MRKNRLYLFLLGIGISGMLGVQILSTFLGRDLTQIAAQATLAVADKNSWNKTLANEAVNDSFKVKTKWEALFAHDKTGLYLFEKDSLVYWNNSQWEMNEGPQHFKNVEGLAELKHGYFLYHKAVLNKKTVLVLCLIKPKYELQNNYLDNSFSEWTNIPKEVEIDFLAEKNNTVRFGNEILFGIKGSEPVYYDAKTDMALAGIFTIFFLLVLIGLLLLVRKGVSGMTFGAILFGVILIRAAMLLWHVPEFLNRTPLFDPRLFGNAQSFMNGFLGDILFNALLFLFIATAFHFHLNLRERGSALIRNVLLLFVLLFVLFNQFNTNLISLVNNSTFDFNFLSIFSIKPIVFVALAGNCVLLLAVFISIHNLTAILKTTSKGSIVLILPVLGICLLQHLRSPTNHLIESCWLLPAAFIIFFTHSENRHSIALSLGTYILLMSVVSSALINFYVEKNQLLDLEVLMEKLGERQDQILESEFAGLPEKIKHDESFMNLIELLPNSEKELEQKLKQKYFNGYFERYDIGFSLFDKDCNPMLSAKPAVLLNEGYFDDRINNYSSPVEGGLFFVKDYPLNTQYLARIDLGTHKLFAQIEAKQFEEVGSFPDLFLDKSLQKQDKLRSFTYAVYRSRQNTNRFGDFNYPFFLQDSATLVKSSPGFVHYYFEPEASTNIVISQTAKNWKYFFTFNSYLLLFFSFFTYCCYFIYALLFTSQFRNSSLTRRVQTIIILLLLLAMSAVGITSGNLVKQQFESENKKQLEEKTSVIISELTRQFSIQQLFDETQKDFLNARLREYSRLFNTPISLFKKNGALFNTSEPKLYDFGLAASFVNPHAFGELSDNLSSAICVTEQAGNLNYLSLYTPLFDSNKRITGFINLPYFAKQGDLTNELSQIISALINVYVILFVLSIVAGLILSGYITQPLRLIKQQLAKITLGKQNEKIIWQSNDEIGKLVAEYNLMLLKLEESANLLARSERESAWREMAKQVAHEIKNPLTPMKLNLQYLQHLMKSNPDDFKERFEKASAGIIEQIDALASIATEFSNFAKLPGASLQSIPLVELINSAVHVFENQRNVIIRNHIKATELFVRGDKEQCLRVFNNILKNAVQATEEKENAVIEIDVEQNEATLTVLITDNGCGIDDGLKPKIFSPNFTTKSTGSGLGLAMVKNIMEGFGGSIRFESEKDKGTTFYLEFKSVNA